MQPAVLSAFDRTTNFVQPWAEAGYLCHCVDLQHKQPFKKDGNILLYGCDVLDFVLPENIQFAAFFPPCTDVAVSGARHFQTKGLSKLIDALTLFLWCVETAEHLGCPWMIENPVSTVSTYWRKPDHQFQPYHYGDPYRKTTCLWVGGGFVMPPVRHKVYPSEGGKLNDLPPSPERANRRAETPLGFARSVFIYNSRR